MKKRRKYAILEKIYRKKNFCAKGGRSMKKVLFVDCCIRREASRSKELAEKPFWRRENSTIRVSAMRISSRRRIKS